ncbi:pyrophosphate-energized vacuolar membrane proton pump [Pyrus ussuriensis x Pyrus communis]|uniref:Pyrophosphate-energized vacuolar membrane proton pump n=1 Tax=Pyrus ussuriensis x Pyrus communis TaxID=2448454 RepID=A0A5N5FH79_9ROSA|nr:pyrophosphate-energized vacuolar membrane proton pump [Pyrus ussuriensis x Pyrus communis]
MGATILPNLGAEILIPLCAVIRIAFSLVQWMYVSQVKLSLGSSRDSNSSNAGKNGYNDYLIEEEEGVMITMSSSDVPKSEPPFPKVHFHNSEFFIDKTASNLFIWFSGFGLCA